jgi:iron complex outermembrane recepter protein
MLPVLALAAIGPAPLAAPPGEQQTIIVTGERVTRTLRDTPSSVKVITATEIEAQAADRVDQLLAMIPNVQLGSGSDGPSVRGQDTTGVLHDLPAFLGGNRPRLTLQVDGRAVTYNEFAYGAAPLWDVERVEVFRSPQTTTQGRNSIAGAIFVETQEPTWDWQGRARAIVGNLDTRQFSAVASGPVIGDAVAFRLSGDQRHNRAASRIGRNANGGPDPNEDEYGQVRAKLLVQPAALAPAKLELIYAHTQSHAPQTEGISPPFHERRNPGATYGIFRTNIDSLTGRLNWKESDAIEANGTFSFGDAGVQRFAPRGFGETRIHSRDLSGEAIARWRPSGSIDLLGGASALRTRLHQRIDLSATPLGIGTFDDVQKSVGVFAQAELHPAARFTLTAGVRYERDRQDRIGTLTARPQPIPLDYHRTFDAWLPRLSVEYAFSEHASVGVLAQRAFNPGGTTIDLRLGKADDFDAETLWDYELFARAAIPGTGLTFASNLFYYDMRDAQRPQERELRDPNSPGVVTFLEISNAPRARTAGLEAELGWRPSDRLSLQGSVGLLSTKVTKTLDPADPLLAKKFQRSPALTAAASLDWKPLRQLRLSAQVRHNSPYFSDDEETPALKVGSSTTVNARAAWDARSFTLFAFARNLTDEFHLTYFFNPSLATAGKPRELGAGIEARF